MLPLRLNALVEMGPGAASKAITEVILEWYVQLRNDGEKNSTL